MEKDPVKRLEDWPAWAVGIVFALLIAAAAFVDGTLPLEQLP